MNALKSTGFGLLLIVASAILLFWAEGRAVKTARALEEGSGLVIEVAAVSVDAANEGRLVHISGEAVPQGVPGDQRLGLEADGAVRLERTVEMYQWREVSKDVERTGSDGSKTRTTVLELDKVWSETPIDSKLFKSANAPDNPPMTLKSVRFDVGEVKVGAFRLAGKNVAGLGEESAVRLTEEGAARVSSGMGPGTPVWLIDNRFVVAADPGRPEIGDLRVSYTRGDVDRLSAVGAQEGERLTPFVASNGREVFLIQRGTASAAEMFKTAIEDNRLLTWIIRGLGLVLMFVGFKLSFSLLTAVAGYIPILGGLVGLGTTLVALALTLVLGSVVIALGWIFYRPLLALAIVALGVGIAVAMGVYGRKTQAQVGRA